MDCNNCTKHDEKKEPVTVPLFAVEGQNFRSNQTSRHLATMFCICLIVIAIIIGLCGMVVYQTNRDCLEKIDEINKYWIAYISEYDYGSYSYEYSQDGRGLNIIGNSNGVDASGVIDDGTETGYPSTDSDEEGR